MYKKEYSGKLGKLKMNDKKSSSLGLGKADLKQKSTVKVGSSIGDDARVGLNRVNKARY